MVSECCAMGACSESGYVWTQMVYDTTGNILTNPDFSNPVKKTLRVHVCRNITKAMNTNCSSKGLAPVYMVKTSPFFSPLSDLAMSPSSILYPLSSVTPSKARKGGYHVQ